MTQQDRVKQGRRLARAMSAAKLNDRELAKSADLPVWTVRRYLAGAMAIGATNAIKLARVLGVSVEYVLYGETNALAAP